MTADDDASPRKAAAELLAFDIRRDVVEISMDLTRMIAAFGSIAHVPLAMLLMVGEMTGNLSLLAPAMVAVAIATLVVGEESIYESQVPSRMDSPANRHRYTYPLLPALRAAQAIRPVVRAAPTMSVVGLRDLLTHSNTDHAVVVDSAGKVVGDFVSEGAPADTAAHAPLTERESQIIRRVARGFSNKEIAAQFDISVKTVETHKLRSMEKLGLSSRAEVVEFALRQGWLAQD